MIKISLLSTIDDYDKKLHDFTFRQIKDHPIDRFECHKGVNLISFDWIDVTHPNAEPSQIIIYFSEKDLMFFCENEVTLDVVNSIMEKIDREDDTNEMILYGFFTELIKHDTDNLERLEDEITVLEEEVVLKPQYASSKRIIYYRNITRKLRKYYDQLSIITNSLNDNENELISQDYWRHFEILDHRVDRMVESVRNLREYVTQVREAYQAQIDIEQNNIMKVFTIISGIFLPLTLLVGWYGMNFNMPEFQLKYGYPIVIGISVMIVVVCILFFRKKKWM